MENLTERYGQLPDSHYVPDVLTDHLSVVFCGTALGFQSARAKAYYAHPGNLFWRALHETGMTPHRIVPKNYTEVTRYGIGLTDLCKNAYGLDTQLPKDAFDVEGLRQKILRYRPRYLAFTSKTAAGALLGKSTARFAYGLQSESLGDTSLFVLPSPSGQARVFWNLSVWQELALLIGNRDRT